MIKNLKIRRSQITLTILAIVCLSYSVFSQTDYEKEIQGIWNYIDEHGQKQEFIVTGNTWTVKENWPLNKNKTKWQQVSFIGQFSFIEDDKIHVIFNDSPREEGYIKIKELADGQLIIKKSSHKNMWRSKKYIYHKERSHE